tara:strand:+ start:3232 stop:3816 length:585 start_codon:yes stop_codon:yes gene_type:complete
MNSKLNFMKTRVFMTGAMALSLLSSCDKDDNKPTLENEEELITTVVVHLTPMGGGQEITFSSVDNDGNGPTAPVVTTEPLDSGITYSVALEFLNETKNPAEDITAEIKAEGDEHQVFYLFDNSLSVSLEYTDKDVNGKPIGLSADLETLQPGSGELTVVLRHQPDKNASGVSDGLINNAGGETDVEAVFPLTIQ